jgi:hypothetical protein
MEHTKMSGPIVRRYGFPNFDKIFGKKELEHGADEPGTPSEAPAADKPADVSSEESKAETKPGA